MHFLFCPHDSPGFLLPLAGLANALQQRGHTISFVPRSPAFAVAMWHVPRGAAEQARVVATAIGEVQPDVVVASALGLGALMAAEQCEVPVAVMGLMDELPPPDHTASDELDHAHWAARAWMGMPPRDAGRMRGDVYLRRSLPSLAPDLREGSVLVGPCLRELPPSPDLDRWLAVEGAPVVYAHQARTFGGPGFWDELCALEGVRVAASTSRMDAAPLRVPPGGMVGPMVDQSAVLRKARAVVCSGTTTVSLGALTHGVPSVILPAGTEQFAIANRMEAAGCALTLTVSELTSHGLQRAVHTALGDGPLRERANSLAVEAQAFRGFERAAETVEALPHDAAG